MNTRFFPLTTLAIALLCSAGAHAQELRATLADQQEVAVTIYNDNLALVKDLRRLTLPTGAVPLAFRDVSAKMRPETALFISEADIKPARNATAPMSHHASAARAGINSGTSVRHRSPRLRLNRWMMMWMPSASRTPNRIDPARTMWREK